MDTEPTVSAVARIQLVLQVMIRDLQADIEEENALDAGLDLSE